MVAEASGGHREVLNLENRRHVLPIRQRRLRRFHDFLSPCGDVPEQLFPHGAQQIFQSHAVDVGFQQIVVGPQPEGLPHKLKFVVAGQGDGHGHPPLLAQPLHQLKAAHPRHFHVRDQKVDSMIFQVTQRLIAVAAVLHHRIAQVLPHQKGTQRHMNQRIVIHDQNPNHWNPPHVLYRRPGAA